MTAIVRVLLLSCPAFAVFAQRAACTCVVDGRTTCRQRRCAGDAARRGIDAGGVLADAPTRVQFAATEKGAVTVPMARVSSRSFAEYAARARDARKCLGGLGALARDAR